MTAATWKLPIKQHPYFVLKYRDFDRAVNEFYARPYEFAADQESPNDTTHEFRDIDGSLDRWDEERLTTFQGGQRPGWLARVLLNDLCRSGVIPPGDYLIRVSW